MKKSTNTRHAWRENTLWDEARQELIRSIEQWLERDITLVEDLMIIAARKVVTYAADQRSKMDVRLTNQVGELFAEIDFSKKRSFPPSWYARAIYTLNPTGFCEGNCAAVKRNTECFCKSYFAGRDDDQREFERRNSIDLEPLYEWWVETQSAQKGK